MKTLIRSLFAWAFSFIAFSVPVLAVDMTFTDYTSLLIQAGVIAPSKASIAMQVAKTADDVRSVPMKDLATMAEIQPDGKITGGLVLGKGEQARFLIRAVGPGLQAFGVSGVLSDPRVTAYKGQTVIAVNDNWGSNDPIQVNNASTNVGAFPLTSNSLDSVLVLYLKEGEYTFVVEGVGGATGTVLLEIYKVP